MPSKSLRFCLHKGCKNLTRKGYCPGHKGEAEEKRKEHLKRYDKRRGTAAQRGYDGQWDKARQAYLSAYPLCERCEKEGRTTVAVLVHHIKPIDEGGERLNAENFMALCNDCHERIHGRKK